MNKKILIPGIFLLSILFIYTVIFAGTKDSLKNLTFNKDIKVRTNSFLQLADIYYNINLDSSQYYAKQAFKNAKKQSDKKLIFFAYKRLGINYAMMDNFKKSLEYFKYALDLANEIDNDIFKTKILHNISILYKKQADFKNAFDYCYKAIESAKELEDKRELSDAYYNLASIYFKQADNNKALNYYEKSYQIVKELDNNEIDLADYYNSIAIIYCNMGKFDKSIDYYNKSISIFKKLGKSENNGEAYQNLGCTYLDIHNYQKAIDCFTESLNIYYKLNFPDDIAFVKQNLGLAYIKIKEYSKAMSSLNEAEEYFTQTKSDYDLSFTYEVKELYMKMGNYHKAKGYLIKSLSLFSKFKDRFRMSECYEHLHSIAKTEKDYESALNYFNEKNKLQSEQNNIDKEYLITSIQQKNKSERETEKTLAENRLHQSTIEKQNIVILFVSLFLFASLVFSLVILKLNRTIRKQNIELLSINNKIQTIYKTMMNDMNSSVFPLYMQIMNLKEQESHKDLVQSFENFSKTYNQLLEDVQ